MSTAINHLLATERVADLHRAAERTRGIHDRWRDDHTPTIELRLRRPDESAVDRRLAELDEAPALEGPVLLALADGEAVAALSLKDQRVVANPFVATGNAVALLRLRAEHLSGGRARRRGLRHVLRLRAA